MFGVFNAYLARSKGAERDKDIELVLEAAKLEDLLVHFPTHQCLWCQYGRTWIMVRLGREVWSRTDYIIGMDQYIFWNFIT